MSFRNLGKNTFGDIGRHKFDFRHRTLNDPPFDAELIGLSIAGIAVIVSPIDTEIFEKWWEIRILINHIPGYGANVVHKREKFFPL